MIKRTLILLKAVASAICQIIYASIETVAKVVIALILSDGGEKKTKNISFYDYPGSDPMYDGEYKDWQGVTYSKDISGNWTDSWGNEYEHH